MTTSRRSERFWWLAAAGWTLVIYLTIPAAQWIRDLVNDRWGRGLFTAGVLVVLGLASIAAGAALGRRHGWQGGSRYLWLAGTLVVFAWSTLELGKKAPEEAVHFLQYGGLGLICFRALSFRLRDSGAYFCAVLICALVGTVDEVIQWVTPDRYWDFRDVGLNAAAGALAQVALWKAVRPASIQQGWSFRSLRLTARLGMAELLLLALCASNTPEVVDWYVSKIPRLGYLRTNPSVMAEYGYRHEDPEVGIFYSRFSLEELARLDRKRGPEVAAILDDYRPVKRYPEFLANYTAATAPFVHEARVHLFRRDRYLWQGRRKKEAPERGEWFNVAYREHLIMERYFPHTLAASSYQLPPKAVQEMRRHAESKGTYSSAVGAHLITAMSLGEIWLIVLLGCAALVGLDLYLGRRGSSERITGLNVEGSRAR